MSAFYDRSVKKLIMGIAFIMLLMILWDTAICIHTQNELKYSMIRQQCNISSSLMENGVDENIIARAFVNNESSYKGIALVDKLGFDENFSFVMPLPVVIKTAVISLLLFTVVIFFVMRRNKLYENAINDIRNCKNISVSYSDKGSIYRLFDSINNMTEALKAKRETEQKTKEFLKQTVSDISHQLKTPLSALSMYNELILDEPEDPENVREFTKKSEAAIERIETLILTLLKLTRLDADAVEFDKKVYSAREVICKSIQNLRYRAEKENKEINIYCNDENINCDIEWTSEAIGNIVKNALDHTSDGGVINISCEKTPLECRISISDNGKGIDNEDFHHIFKRFYRSRRGSDTQGIGLGLPFAKSVTEGQGGIIYVESEKDKGTVFTLSFPDLTEM